MLIALVMKAAYRRHRIAASRLDEPMGTHRPPCNTRSMLEPTAFACTITRGYCCSCRKRSQPQWSPIEQPFLYSSAARDLSRLTPWPFSCR